MPDSCRKDNFFCQKSINPSHAEWFKMPCPPLIVSQSDYLIQVVDTNSHSAWQTVQIQINWLLQKPTDLDLHCFQRQGISRFRVQGQYSYFYINYRGTSNAFPQHVFIENFTWTPPLSRTMVKCSMWQLQTHQILPRPEVIKLFPVFNSAEHEICPANKSQITNNCKFFLTKHSWAWKFLC